MRLSIITVNFNNRDGLIRTAKSVTDQTFSDFEWIVVDGGSTDGSVDVIKEYADRISWSVSEPDGGIYEAMNKGLERASGEYVQFLNSGDSLIDRAVLEKVFQDPALADVNYGDQWCSSGDKVVEKRQYPDKMDLAYLFRNPLGHQASFVRTSVAKAHPYRVKYTISADRAFFLELYLSGASFHHINLPVVFFDTDGIGSREDTKEQRGEQLRQIKRELLTAGVVEDIERLIDKSENIDFVTRVAPLRWMYQFFRWLQRIR
ncbi:MAG: glycosyltransferase [Bacteroidales bacterium]|nr:glycosyltransferase [Bacteroidales bacterium]